jgi:hypothetical protein
MVSSLPRGEIFLSLHVFNPIDMSDSYANGYLRPPNQTYLANKMERGEDPVELVRVEISRWSSIYADIRRRKFYSRVASCAS